MNISLKEDKLRDGIAALGKQYYVCRSSRAVADYRDWVTMSDGHFAGPEVLPSSIQFINEFLQHTDFHSPTE